MLGKCHGRFALAGQWGPIDNNGHAAAIPGGATLHRQVNAQILSDRIEHRILLHVADGLGSARLVHVDVVRFGLAGLVGLVSASRVDASRFGRLHLVQRVRELLLLLFLLLQLARELLVIVDDLAGQLVARGARRQQDCVELVVAFEDSEHLGELRIHNLELLARCDWW